MFSVLVGRENTLGGVRHHGRRRAQRTVRALERGKPAEDVRRGMRLATHAGLHGGHGCCVCSLGAKGLCRVTGAAYHHDGPTLLGGLESPKGARQAFGTAQRLGDEGHNKRISGLSTG